MVDGGGVGDVCGEGGVDELPVDAGAEGAIGDAFGFGVRGNVCEAAFEGGAEPPPIADGGEEQRMFCLRGGWIGGDFSGRVCADEEVDGGLGGDFWEVGARFFGGGGGSGEGVGEEMADVRHTAFYRQIDVRCLRVLGVFAAGLAGHLWHSGGLGRRGNLAQYFITQAFKI